MTNSSINTNKVVPHGIMNPKLKLLGNNEFCVIVWFSINSACNKVLQLEKAGIRNLGHVFYTNREELDREALRVNLSHIVDKPMKLIRIKVNFFSTGLVLGKWHHMSSSCSMLH